MSDLAKYFIFEEPSEKEKQRPVEKAQFLETRGRVEYNIVERIQEAAQADSPLEGVAGCIELFWVRGKNPFWHQLLGGFGTIGDGLDIGHVYPLQKNGIKTRLNVAGKRDVATAGIAPQKREACARAVVLGLGYRSSHLPEENVIFGLNNSAGSEGYDLITVDEESCSQGFMGRIYITVSGAPGGSQKDAEYASLAKVVLEEFACEVSSVLANLVYVDHAAKSNERYNQD